MLMRERLEICKGLELLLEEGEYCSHSTALFLLGHLASPPGILTIVTSSRRRPRRIGSRSLTFIHRGRNRIETVPILEMGEHRLAVSSLENSLVDLLAYLDLGPSIETIVEWFGRFPIRVDELIRAARRNSDTVLKRACWLMTLAGRAGYEEIPWAWFSPTPIRLDPRVDSRKALWDGRFHLSFPSHLLGSPAPEPRPDDTPEKHEWLELRRFPPFRKAFEMAGRLPIRGDPSPRACLFLKRWATRFIEDLPKRDFDALLASHAGTLREINSTSRFPVWLHRWFEDRLRPGARSGRVPRLDGALGWARANLDSPNLSRVESAIHIGYSLGEKDPALKSLEAVSYALFDSGRESTLLWIANHRLSHGFHLGPRTCVAVARSLVRSGRSDQALALIEEHLETCNPREEARHAAELRYAKGGILCRTGRPEKGLREYEAARTIFSRNQDSRGLMMVESALGNFHLRLGNTDQAVSHLRASLLALPPKIFREARVVLLTSLAQAEYTRGRFRKCLTILRRARRIKRVGGWNRANLLVAEAKAHLELGQIPRALEALEKTRLIRETWGKPGFCSSLRALLAWCHKLSGRESESDKFVEKIPKEGSMTSDPRGEFVRGTLEAMSSRFGGRFKEAIIRYESLLKRSKELGLSGIESGGLHMGLAMCQSLLSPGKGISSFREAWKRLKETPNRPETRQARVMIAARAPRLLAEIPGDLDQDVGLIISSGALDPFWAWYAGDLIGSGKPAASRFVKDHWSRTPDSMRRIFLERIPGFSRLMRETGLTSSKTTKVFTLLSAREVFTITSGEYQRWRKQNLQGTFLFDGPAGRLSFDNRVLLARPGSRIHRLLECLLLSRGVPIRVEELFASAWGMVFDPEFDPYAFKTALCRLRKALKMVVPGSSIRVVPGTSKWGKRLLKLPCPWEAVI